MFLGFLDVEDNAANFAGAIFVVTPIDVVEPIDANAGTKTVIGAAGHALISLTALNTNVVNRLAIVPSCFAVFGMPLATSRRFVPCLCEWSYTCGAYLPLFMKFCGVSLGVVFGAETLEVVERVIERVSVFVVNMVASGNWPEGILPHLAVKHVQALRKPVSQSGAEIPLSAPVFGRWEEAVYVSIVSGCLSFHELIISYHTRVSNALNPQFSTKIG